MPDAAVSSTCDLVSLRSSWMQPASHQEAVAVFPDGMRLENGHRDRLTSALQSLSGGKLCNPGEVALTELQSQATKIKENRLAVQWTQG